MEGSFWPIAHCIKERQSLNRNRGSGCNKMSDIELMKVSIHLTSPNGQIATVFILNKSFKTT
jgi:hypothetical protein